MPVVGIASLKGGVGKTTAAIYLAECAHQLGSDPVLVDADSEQSALRWASFGRLPFPVVAVSADVARQCRQLQTQHGVVIVDSPPNHREMLAAVAESADHVVVPTLPTGLDLDRLRPTLALLRELDMRRPIDAAILLNRWTRRERLSREALEALESRGLPVLRARVRDLARYRQSFGGRPTYTVEFMSVWKEVAHEQA